MPGLQARLGLRPWRSLGYDFLQQHAKRMHVGGCADAITGQLLGRCVTHSQCLHAGTRAGRIRLVEHLGDAEIE